jgi:hypothetical protein
MAEAVYLMCALASIACAALLFRSYTRTRMGLILWTALCFVGLAASNMLLVIDLAVVDRIDFRNYRTGAALVGVTILLYGMITRRSEEARS